MCLAVPGKILSISQHKELLARTGKVDFSGVIKEISLAYVPEADINDYVIVHAGIALSIVDPDEAKASLEAFQALAESNNDPYLARMDQNK